MTQPALFPHKHSLRSRDYRVCSHCGKTTEHLKEAGQEEFKCQPCEEQRKREAKRQQGGGI